MKYRSILIITMVLALLMMAFPVIAQDGDTPTVDPVELIFAANENLLAAEYFGFSASQRQEQVIYSGEGRRQSKVERTTDLEISNGQIQIDASGVPQQVALTVSQSDEQLINNVSRSAATLTMNSEFRYVDGQLYIRVSRVSGTLNDRAIENAPRELRSRLGTNFLTGWVNVSANPEQLAEDFSYLTIEQSGARYFDFLNVDALVNLGGGLNFTPEAIIDVDTVNSDDPNTLIFSVELDPRVMLENLDITSFVDAEQMTGDVDLLLQELFDAMSITQQVTIELDSEGNPMLNSVVTTISADVTFSDGSQPIDNPPNATGGVSLRLVLDSTTEVEYSSIGRAFELAAPTPELLVATSCNDDTLEGTFTITNRGANMDAPTAYVISQEGALDTEKELQLEAGTRLVETVRNGEYTLTIPEFDISQTLSCVRPEESADSSE
ncbi:MAG: hypothetical protein CUN55_08560 [Phototrophicales bacterium]|nr:MAG: hypothetical protein CUN55_08560 [Phototrophicales bacterium]